MAFFAASTFTEQSSLAAPQEILIDDASDMVEAPEAESDFILHQLALSHPRQLALFTFLVLFVMFMYFADPRAAKDEESAPYGLLEITQDCRSIFSFLLGVGASTMLAGGQTEDITSAASEQAKKVKLYIFML